MPHLNMNHLHILHDSYEFDLSRFCLFQEQRRRLNSVKVIQALVRSFLSRATQKKLQRIEFDSLLTNCGTQVEWKHLCVLTSKLLFFYSHDSDGSRLVSGKIEKGRYILD